MTTSSLLLKALLLTSLTLHAQPTSVPHGRADLLAEIASRPADPWPRNAGHIPLGLPGLPDDWKAYHEPGGSFSPAFASFGISLWVFDAKDRLIATSDSIPLNQIQQSWEWTKNRGWPARPDLPAIQTTTPYYSCTWTILDAAHYQLHIRPNSNTRVSIMIRRPGPSGGPIHALQRSGNSIFLNSQWILEPKGPGIRTEIADPRQPAQPDLFWPAEQHWGYARLQLMPTQDSWLIVRPTRIPPAPPFTQPAGRSLIETQLPDPQFQTCLDAQIALLTMSLSGNETRPGDPNNYPLDWLRDGSYTLVALARSGHASTAQELSRPFAEKDFFGGFGAEADAPGLALWALEEVATILNDPAFNDWLWPHIERKARLIERMQSTTQPLRLPFAGPVVPAHQDNPDLNLVCLPATNGWINGRMDWHHPNLFINAVSYRGLLSASRLAERRGFTSLAKSWTAQAKNLQTLWNQKLNEPDAHNDRTAICGLYPAGIVQNPSAYSQVLNQRRAENHTPADQFTSKPLWTYFELAAAHQHLFLGQTRQVWNDLLWFQSHQASPGLYTWWEGEGEENTFNKWPQAMGWTQPPHVTPHYWTAAQMALLQLDMLVAVDETSPTPKLLIGLGLQPDWMNQKLSAKNLLTRLGKTSWEWNKGRLTVWHQGTPAEIIPGPHFPANTELRLK
ncbi:MAG: hypothetical protein ACO34E_17950 [Limisphaerales bacterium]